MSRRWRYQADSPVSYADVVDRLDACGWSTAALRAPIDVWFAPGSARNRRHLREDCGPRHMRYEQAKVAPETISPQQICARCGDRLLRPFGIRIVELADAVEAIATKEQQTTESLQRAADSVAGICDQILAGCTDDDLRDSASRAIEAMHAAMSVDFDNDDEKMQTVAALICTSQVDRAILDRAFDQYGEELQQSYRRAHGHSVADTFVNEVFNHVPGRWPEAIKSAFSVDAFDDGMLHDIALALDTGAGTSAVERWGEELRRYMEDPDGGTLQERLSGFAAEHLIPDLAADLAAIAPAVIAEFSDRFLNGTPDTVLILDSDCTSGGRQRYIALLERVFPSAQRGDLLAVSLPKEFSTYQTLNLRDVYWAPKAYPSQQVTTAALERLLEMHEHCPEMVDDITTLAEIAVAMTADR